MYDPELKKTRTYFKVLQILRLFSDIIEAGEVEFQSFSDRCSGRWSYSPRGQSLKEEQLIIDQNWTTLKALHQEKTKGLLFKISVMKKEIESLRDGLFNAQSVREAQKSRELNKIMMVFTIVTILFLPRTFVATFFGVEVFHAASDVQTRKIFWTVFSIVTVTTLVTSLGTILGLLTPASWTRLRSAMPKLRGRSDNLLAEQEKPEKTQNTWRQLSSFLRRDRKGSRTSEEDSTLA
ncbi:hypothetical protein CCHR01_04229 [Colletotrichum chrysophilum]|uniref:Ankyrin repeat protein n=1 Tax=Colletotrichum chrysophilum TaxID=1836956 RepID=A0AAD9ARE1_9PEZI|nr:hypothetical protein CCHR01_04229 [Colletotrichum chrysophilum]